jgi:hypothetical protein
MATTREKRERRQERKRAGSGGRDAKHRIGGEWTTITVPEGTDIWKPKAGAYKIDIVPYEVGEGNPYAQPGTWYYERTFYVHRSVGPNNESHVCLAKTFGKPCPICEYRAKLARDPDTDEKEMRDLKPKERQLWLVFDRNEPEKGVQLWEFSFHCFGKLLDMRRQEAESDEPHVANFDDPEAGAILKISFAEKDAGGYSFLEVYSIDFRPRANGLDDDLLNHGVCLDSLIKEMPYDKLKSLFLQVNEEDEEDEEDGNEPKGRGRTDPRKAKVKAKSEEDDDWPDDEDDEPKPSKKSAKAKPKDDEDEDWPDDEDEEEPEVKKKEFNCIACSDTGLNSKGGFCVCKKGRKKKADIDRARAAKKKPEPEEDDDWPDDEDDEPKPLKKSAKAKPEPEEDEDEDDELVRKKATGKSKGKPKGKPKDDEDEDDWD